MKRHAQLYGVLFAAVLVLSACDGDSPDGRAAETTPAGPVSTNPAGPAESADSPAPAEPSSSASAEGDAEGDAEESEEEQGLDNEELRELVSSLENAEGDPLTVVPAAQLDQVVAQTKQLLESVTINPPECRAFASEELQVPEGSSYAAGVSQSPEEKTHTTITIMAVEDPHAITDQLSEAQDVVDQCADYDIEVQGQTISSHVEQLDVETDGEMSFGAVITQEFPAGGSQSIMYVSGLQGSLAATAVKVGAAIPEAAQEELVQLVNNALAASE